MSDDIEILRTMYQVQNERSEHYENQRATLTNLLLTLAAALVALATFDSKLSRADIWEGLLITLLGGFGFIASKLHSQRARRHGKRAEAYRNALDEKLPGAGINKIRRQVHEESTLLDNVWDGVHIAIPVVGLLIAIFALAAG